MWVLLCVDARVMPRSLLHLPVSSLCRLCRSVNSCRTIMFFLNPVFSMVNSYPFCCAECNNSLSTLRVSFISSIFSSSLLSTTKGSHPSCRRILPKHWSPVQGAEDRAALVMALLAPFPSKAPEWGKEDPAPQLQYFDSESFPLPVPLSLRCLDSISSASSSKFSGFPLKTASGQLEWTLIFMKICFHLLRFFPLLS